MKNKLVFLTIVLAIFALLFAGCSSSTQAEKDNEIYIGVSGPFTGDNAEIGEMWKRGFDIALDELNGKGGIGGRQVKLIYEDSQADPKQAANIAQKFIKNDKIYAVFGDFSTNATWAGAPIYQNAGLLQLAFTPTHPNLTKDGDFIFQLSPTQVDQAKSLADFALNKIKAKRIAVINLNTDFGKAVRDQVVEEIKRQGGEVLITDSYLPTDKDFKAQLTKFKEVDPDLIILGSYYNDAALIVKQAKALGLKANYLASSSVHSPALITLGGEAVEGLITLSVFNQQNPNETLAKFLSAYTQKFGEKEPDTFAVLAYESIRLIANAAEQALENGELNRQTLRDELANTKELPGATQNFITFNATRQLEQPEMFPIQIKDGKFVGYEP